MFWGLVLLNFLPVLGTFMSNTPIEDMLLFYLVFKHIFTIVAVSRCNVLTVGCLYAAMWTNFCLNHMCWSCTNIYVWFATMNRRKFLLFTLSTTFMIISAFGIGIWVATVITVLPKLNASCIIHGGGDGQNDTGTSVLSNLNSNVTERKRRVCGKRSANERGQENCVNDLPPPSKRGRNKQIS